MQTVRRWFIDALVETVWTFAAVVVPGVVVAIIGLTVNRLDQTPAGVWYPLVLGVVCGYLTYIALNEIRKARRSRVHEPPAFRAVYDEVCGLTDAAGPSGSVDTALLVLDEARSGYGRAFSGAESVEAKASALLSIVAGASSAVGIFGFGKEGRPIVVTHPVGAALSCVVLALVLLFYILRAKQLPQPSVSAYMIPAMADRDNRIGIALRLASTYEDAGLKITRATAGEPAALLGAATLTSAAAVLILLNASFPCPATPSAALAAVCPAPTPSPSSVPSARGFPGP